MRIIKRFLFIVILFSVSFSASAQLEKVQAAFIYNFTKYMEWPTQDRNGDFVIGVINSPEMVSALNAMVAGKLVGMQKIVVKSFSSVGSISDCHMVYLSVSSSTDLSALLDKLLGKRTIILSSKDGLAQKGADINFIIANQKQSFELNKTVIKGKGIMISSRLEDLAAKVY